MEAQNRLLERYRPQVVGYARYRLLQLGVRCKDADDIAQEVFIGLFRRAGAGKLPDLNTRDDLWSKLQRIASRTGDDLGTISRLGFSVEEPDVAVLDPEPKHRRPNVVDWDQLAASRN